MKRSLPEKEVKKKRKADMSEREREMKRQIPGDIFEPLNSAVPQPSPE